MNNIRKTWKGINNLIANNKKNLRPIFSLKDPETNELIKESLPLPNLINKHFASVGCKITSNLSTTNSKFTDYMQDIMQEKSFFFNLISREEIKHEIELIPNNKSYGLYSCPVGVLKCAKEILSEPLATIMNASVQMGKYNL